MFLINAGIGRGLKMIHLRTPDPYSDLKRNCYSFPELFDATHDFQLELAKEDPLEKALLFRKKYNGFVGYAYVVCMDTELDSEKFKTIFQNYSKTVREYGKRDFKEVELSIIVKTASQDVLDQVAEYNKTYSRRNPIRIFVY
jgi:hypothetical protein